MTFKSIIVGTVAALLTTTAAMAEEMKMAVTTSFANSGLADVLLPKVKEETGIEVQLLIVGTGHALALGAAGDVDSVLVHSKAAEEKWLAEGNGTHRTEIMYNDFVFVGPQEDPAKAGGVATATGTLQAIAGAEAPFVSRGDDSGTHKMELRLWKAADVPPEGDWYKAVGQGMGAALNTASGMNAYIMSDRASWLKFANKGDLGIVFEGDPVLFNQYAYLPVNTEKHPHVKTDLVNQLEAWLLSDKAETLINSYTIEGQQLFVYNAAE